MKAIEDLKEVYPELEILEPGRTLAICGPESEVDLADARMDQYIPTEYKRLMLVVDCETMRATRTYRRND